MTMKQILIFFIFCISSISYAGHKDCYEQYEKIEATLKSECAADMSSESCEIIKLHSNVNDLYDGCHGFMGSGAFANKDLCGRLEERQKQYQEALSRHPLSGNKENQLCHIN
jgi:hypothetical protein